MPKDKIRKIPLGKVDKTVIIQDESFYKSFAKMRKEVKKNRKNK